MSITHSRLWAARDTEIQQVRSTIHGGSYTPAWWWQAQSAPSGPARFSPSVLWIPDRRWDVLVEAEKVGRVVTSLDRPEPIPSRAWVGLAHPRCALVAEEADVCAGILLA